MASWYYARAGSQAGGPVDLEELHRLCLQGTITAETLVINAAAESAMEWKPYGLLFPGTLPPVPLPAPALGEKRLISGLLAIFLGSLGVHKFYLGYTNAGLTMLASTFLVPFVALFLTIATCGVGALFFIPLAFLAALCSHALAVVEGIIYLTKSDAEFLATYVYGRREWF